MSRSRLFSTRLLPVLAGGLVLSGLLSMTAAAQFPFRADADKVEMAPQDCNLPIVPAEPCAAAAVYAAHLQELRQQPVPPPGRDQQMYFHMLHCLETAFHQQQRYCDEANSAMQPQPGNHPLPPETRTKPPARIPHEDMPYEPVAPVDVGQPGDPSFCQSPELEELSKRPCENIHFLEQQIRQVSSQLPPPGVPMTGVQELRLRPLFERLRCLETWRQRFLKLCKSQSHNDENPYEPRHPAPETSFSRSPSPRQPVSPGGMFPPSMPPPELTIRQNPVCDRLIREFQSAQYRHQRHAASPRQGLFIQRQLQQIEMRLLQLCPEATRVIRQN